MCIQDNERYKRLVANGWIKPNVDICFQYGFYNTCYAKTLWDAYVDETFGLENDLQFWATGKTPEEALERLFKSVEAWYAPSC